MKFSAAIIASIAGLAAAMPQGVTQVIPPKGATPSGCKVSMDGTFEVAIVNLAKRDLPIERRGCETDGILVVTLKDGVLTDAKSRTGYIADNFQFQFDAPPQAGAIITGGFAVCGNGSLSLGPSTTFYQCLSGSFYNLYDRHWAAQCSPVNINVLACGSAGSVGQIPDGQIVGTTVVATTIVTVLSDGQPQVVPTSVPIPICQIGDGQVQGHTTPCAAIPMPTVTPISQISDGQIQVPPPSGAPAPPSGPAPTTAPPAPGASTTPAGPSASKSTTAAPSPSGSASSSSPAPSAPATGSSTHAIPSSIVALAVGLISAVLFL